MFAAAHNDRLWHDSEALGCSNREFIVPLGGDRS
jgi:hypothetical protein